MRARREKFDDALDQLAQIEGFDDEFETSGLDLGEIEDLVDQRDERRSRTTDRFDIARVLGIERRLAQQFGHAEDARQRGADFVAHGGEKARLRFARGLRPIARRGGFLEPPDFVAQRLVGAVGTRQTRDGVAIASRQRRRQSDRQSEEGASLNRKKTPGQNRKV